MPVSTKGDLEKELAEAEEARDGLQQLLDETEGWDGVEQDAIDEFVNQSPGRDDEPSNYSWSESDHGRDGSGKFASSSNAHSSAADELTKIAEGPVDSRGYAGGWSIQNAGQGKFKLQTDKGTVIGDEHKILDFLEREWKDQEPDRKRIDAAFKRAEGWEDSGWFSPRATEEAKAFQSLPKGTRVVSLNERTHGRLGEIVKDPESGQTRVKFDNEPGYALTQDVEPLDSKLSWRVKEEDRPKAPERGNQLTMFAKDSGKWITKELHQGKGHARAKWGQEARKEGIRSADLHQFAGDILAHDKAFKDEKLTLMREARKTSKSLGYDIDNLKGRLASGKTDPASLRGFDDVAASIAASYPAYFAGAEEDLPGRLFEILSEGNPAPMSEDEAYQEALSHLVENKASAGHIVSEEPIPWQRSDVLEQYALNRARLNVALLADALGGFPAGDYVLYPQGDRMERVRVMTLHGDAGDAVKAPDEAQHVVVVDDRAGGSEGIYYRRGGGEFDLSDANQVDDPEKLKAILSAKQQ